MHCNLHGMVFDNILFAYTLPYIFTYLQTLVTMSQKIQMKYKHYELYSFFCPKFSILIRVCWIWNCNSCFVFKKFDTPFLCVKVYGFIDFSLTIHRVSSILALHCMEVYCSTLSFILNKFVFDKKWLSLNFTYLNHFIFFSSSNH